MISKTISKKKLLTRFKMKSKRQRWSWRNRHQHSKCNQSWTCNRIDKKLRRNNQYLTQKSKGIYSKTWRNIEKIYRCGKLFEDLKQSRSMVHYKLSLLQIFKKLLKNNPKLKNTTLPTTYFRNNFKFTESVC